MRVILDTSIWIEFLKGNQPIHDQVHTLLIEDEVIGISAVFGELFYGVKNKKEEIQITKLWELLPKLNEENSMLKAGRYANFHKFMHKGVGLVDASLAYLALENNAKVWTLDKRLKQNLPYGVSYD
jgi:predicted nucleic acid-binding protein